MFFDLVAGMETQLTYYGHSAFKLTTPRGHVLLIDPWLTNPLFDKGKDELKALKRADLILLTHGHFDHVGDSVDIAKRTGAKLVATFDLSAAMKAVSVIRRHRPIWIRLAISGANSNCSKAKFE